MLILSLLLFSFLNGCYSRQFPNGADLVIVHMSELHLASTGEIQDTSWTHKIIVGGYKLHKQCTGKSFELLERAVTVINEKIKPDAVVITGDIVNNGDDVEALRKGAELIRKLKCPLIIAKGDHDVAKNLENRNAFETEFGPLNGTVTVKGFQFLYIPYEADEKTFEWLKAEISKVPADGKPRFLCMHRMLYASWLMKKLSMKYCPTLLAPEHEKILDMLDKSSGKWIVLCGHSHTNYERMLKNITELCTASLAEYPHELRIIKLKDGEVYSNVMNLDELEGK